ncbi:RNaseH domain-containing protein [Streptomyces sp. CT34]|uniref:RNaseH domain-containing protein n=1 Tax=Streptomyces sp. CT34 TaxID=1553907 RepID=UPI001F52860B|nr:RNaseH domain-containing protein [Streptomyces sp. CT34]
MDTEACHTIWPGLQNIRFGSGPLPGDDLRPQRSVAVVANNTSYGEVPAPVENTASPRKSLKRPSKPQDRLYRRTTSTGLVSWYIAQTSRTYEGFSQAGSIGGLHTRFTLPKDDWALQREDWHSLTATQITVPHAGNRARNNSPPSPHSCATSRWPGRHAPAAPSPCTSPTPWTARTPITGAQH